MGVFPKIFSNFNSFNRFGYRKEPEDTKLNIKQELITQEDDSNNGDNSICSESNSNNCANMQSCKTEVKCKEEPTNAIHQMDNDPQPGPSGLHTMHRDAPINTAKRNRVIDSSDEESFDGDHLNGTGPWIARRMNGPMPVVPKLEIESPTADEMPPINEYHANCSRESHIESVGDLLNAPDLQLDCLSDSSDEYVPPPAPMAPDLVKIEPQSPPHIDLTRDTDDEEFVRLPTSRLRLDNNQHHYHTIRSPNSSRIFRPKQRHIGYAYTEESVSYLACL